MELSRLRHRSQEFLSENVMLFTSCILSHFIAASRPREPKMIFVSPCADGMALALSELRDDNDP